MTPTKWAKILHTSLKTSSSTSFLVSKAPICHRGIFFTFFGHFLHLLFSLLIHFYAFSVMFYAYSLRIFDLSMTNSLSNLISVILSFRPDFTFVSLSLLILWNHTYDYKTNGWYWRTTTRKLPTTRYRRGMGIYKTFNFLILKVLEGLSLSSRCLLCPSYPKPTLSLLLITWWFPQVDISQPCRHLPKVVRRNPLGIVGTVLTTRPILQRNPG